ncbi:NAD-binding protein [uncultured Endozoicomonas sp.]|uniref:NAD-binding protein n=1 Tax=uncultured Endozoicomonas sp. TaxID=432652 RepID=UPI002610B2E3|nr:NAD-binding protein [uncultured Endozoicomonas sp.]
MRRINVRSFYGDACQPDLLHTAGINECKLMVVAIDDPPRSVTIVHYIKQHSPMCRYLPGLLTADITMSYATLVRIMSLAKPMIPP